MNENETLVTEVTENAEQTAEQTPKKTYTEDEVNAIVGKKKAYMESRLRKEYDRRYGDLEDVLKAGMGKEDIGEITEDLRKFYSERMKDNFKVQKRDDYSQKDIEALAKADAEEIMRFGDDVVAEEVNRLAELGVENMSAREKATFKVLAEHRQNTETSRELSSIGVTEDVYNSKEFKDFKSKFNPNTPIKDIYDIYNKTLPKKEYQTMGSMKTTESNDNGVKDYYSPEEARKFTKKDYDANPALFKAVCNSMPKWKK